MTFESYDEQLSQQLQNEHISASLAKDLGQLWNESSIKPQINDDKCELLPGLSLDGSDEQNRTSSGPRNGARHPGNLSKDKDAKDTLDGLEGPRAKNPSMETLQELIKEKQNKGTLPSATPADKNNKPTADEQPRPKYAPHKHETKGTLPRATQVDESRDAAKPANEQPSPKDTPHNQDICELNGLIGNLLKKISRDEFDRNQRLHSLKQAARGHFHR